MSIIVVIIFIIISIIIIIIIIIIIMIFFPFFFCVSLHELLLSQHCKTMLHLGHLEHAHMTMQQTRRDSDSTCGDLCLRHTEQSSLLSFSDMTGDRPFQELLPYLYTHA